MTLETPETQNRELEALLEFYQASGVSCFLEDQALDRFSLSLREAGRAPAAGQAEPAASAPSQNVRQSASIEAPASRPPVAGMPGMPAAATGGQAKDVVVPDKEAVNSAREMVGQVQSLEELRRCLEGFTGCNLRLTAKNLVFADGSPQARIMFVGEAPGRDEDRLGKPFVGRSGQLLDKMLAAIGLARSDAYIANVVPWRPPGNRTPTPQETEICKPFIQKQIELANPDVLVFLGAASAKSLLGVQDGIRRLRGRWMSYKLADRQIPCLAMYHPAYLLRSPIEKRLSWRDFLSVKEKLAK